MVSTLPVSLEDIRAAAAPDCRPRALYVDGAVRFTWPNWPACLSISSSNIIRRPAASSCAERPTRCFLLSPAERSRGFVAASTGNHGRALAYAAKAEGAVATICMSRLVPENKVSEIRRLGADVRIVGRSQDEAQQEVDRLVREEGLVMVPPFDDPDVVAGQGTLGLEIIDTLPEAAIVLVPLSGGGLAAGVAAAVKGISPKTKVIGLTMEKGAAMKASLDAGRPVQVEELSSLADSLGGGIGLDNRVTFAMCRDLLDEVILLTEAEIAAGMRHAYACERADRRRRGRGRHCSASCRENCGERSHRRDPVRAECRHGTAPAGDQWQGGTLWGGGTMSRMIILTEAELRKVIALDRDAVDCVEDAFAALATKAVAMPPILRLDIPEYRGEVDVKTAYVPGIEGFAIKISPGFFDNPKIGLPSTNGMMVLLSSRTGLVQALLLDNGYLTDVRTAAAGAVAAKHLSRENASVAAIFGAGMQARLQLEALTLVRPIREARIWARDSAKAQSVAAELAAKLGFSVTATPDARGAVTGADLIVTTTPSETPIIDAGWLEPGQHLTAMGSDAEHKNEIDPAAIAVADLYVADSLKQTRRLGELHHAIDGGLVADDAIFAELGQIVAGRTRGRTRNDQITIADLTGTGIQDTAIATLAFTRAGAANAGTTFES